MCGNALSACSKKVKYKIHGPVHYKKRLLYKFIAVGEFAALNFNMVLIRFIINIIIT